MAIVEVASPFEWIPGIHADYGSFDGENAPIQPPIENVVFETPICNQVGTGQKRANLRRKAFRQRGPRGYQAVRLPMLDECIEIRKRQAEVKWQFQLEQAKPSLFCGNHVARFRLEVEIVKEYRSLKRKHLQNRAVVTRRAGGKQEHVPVRRTVSCENNLKGAQPLWNSMSPKVEIGESPVDLRRIWEEPEGALESVQCIVRAPCPIVEIGRAHV